jgi:hypothetical protein
LVLLCWQQLLYCVPKACANKQTLELPLPTGFALLLLQQLLWHLEAGTLQAGPRTPAARRLCSPMPAVASSAPGRLCGKAGPKAPTAQRLGTPVHAAAAMAPGSPHPNTSRPLSSTALWSPDDSSPPDLLHVGTSTCYSVPGAHYHTNK